MTVESFKYSSQIWIMSESSLPIFSFRSRKTYHHLSTTGKMGPQRKGA